MCTIGRIRIFPDLLTKLYYPIIVGFRRPRSCASAHTRSCCRRLSRTSGRKSSTGAPAYANIRSLTPRLAEMCQRFRIPKREQLDLNRFLGLIQVMRLNRIQKLASEYRFASTCSKVQHQIGELMTSRRRKAGRPASGKPRSVRATVSLSPEMYNTLAALAKEKKVSTAWIMRDAAEQYLAAQRPLFGKTPSVSTRGGAARATSDQGRD